MYGCSFQQVLRQNLSWFLSYHWKTLSLSGFILKPTERAYASNWVKSSGFFLVILSVNGFESNCSEVKFQNTLPKVNLKK